MNGEFFQKKVSSFLSNYVPDTAGCFVAGGVFPRLYYDLPVRDIDVYVDTDEDFRNLCGEYKACGWTVLKNNKKNFIKLKSPFDHMEVDLIGFHRPRGPEYVRATYDFTICMLTFYEGMLHDEYFNHNSVTCYNAIERKELIFNPCIEKITVTNNLNNPLTRIMKYLKLGFTISDEELTKMYKFFTNHCFVDAKNITPYI